MFNDLHLKPPCDAEILQPTISPSLRKDCNGALVLWEASQARRVLRYTSRAFASCISPDAEEFSIRVPQSS